MNAVEQSTGWEVIDGLFDVSTETAGAPLEFRIFDPQNCDHLQEDWLAKAVESEGISRDELDGMVKEGLVRKRRSPAGNEGFLLYSERQAVMARQLRVTGRYSSEELRHIFADWDSYLEIVTTDELAYDSFDIDDYDHFKRRAAEMLQFFESEMSRADESFAPLPLEYIDKRRTEAAERVKMWRWIHTKVSSCADVDLSPRIQQAWRRQLFHLRWVDEWSRVMMAQQFSTQIEQGYSPEVTFLGHHWEANVTTLTQLNWDMTLGRFKDTINEGKPFPLRTPDFNLTESGIAFLKMPTPAAYAALHEKYDLGRLGELLTERGAAFWDCDLGASGRGECAECSGIFERTHASRKFCSDRCRNKAKARRWREADPDRARRAQAKYYKESYAEDDGA